MRGVCRKQETPGRWRIEGKGPGPGDIVGKRQGRGGGGDAGVPQFTGGRGYRAPYEGGEGIQLGSYW